VAFVELDSLSVVAPFADNYTRVRAEESSCELCKFRSITSPARSIELLMNFTLVLQSERSKAEAESELEIRETREKEEMKKYLENVTN
jgi:hypothetical protein